MYHNAQSQRYHTMDEQGRMLMDNRTIYNLLAKQSISEVTVANLNSATSVSAVDEASIDFWVGPLTVSRIVQATRQYGGGLPIPELSAIETLTISDGAGATFQPTGTEIYSVVSIATNQDVALLLADGSATSSIKTLSGGATYQPTSTFYLTNSLYLFVNNASGSEATVTIAYHKMGM